MKKIAVLLVGLVLQFFTVPAVAQDLLARYEKVIWINQIKQMGAAYEDGCKLCEFPVITGDDETTTDPGIYLIKKKVEDYYSRKYDTPMPYSLFFDLQQRKAIHEGEVPPPGVKKEFSTHGCIHVESPHIEWLYDWADEGKTVVVIQGWRTAD
jgi:lipoprotein-anchoring transpeptidase ErfK/SrfK